jgi:tetratricopeptide (TPR) repeat protein
MRTKKGDVLKFKFSFIVLLIYFLVSINVSIIKANLEIMDFAAFYKAIEVKDDQKAISIGESILVGLEKKYAGNAGFTAYKSKLNSAEFLAKQMQQQLRAATKKQMLSFTEEFFSSDNGEGQKRLISVAPAKQFYETSVKLFSKPVKIKNLTDKEKSFLVQYYNLKLKNFTSEIAKAGQALAVAEPGFEGTHDYVLVLPLLHISSDRLINIEVLPDWMRRPDELDIFADSCLMHFGFPFQAMSLAKKSAQIRKASFSELDYYRSAAKKCGVSLSHIAADCLNRAIELTEDDDTSVTLQFELVQLWQDSKNYALAAGRAKKIFENYPKDKRAAKAVWLYYYSLSRNDNIREILADIDRALYDKKCQPYRAKLMYVKWWALRGSRGQEARTAALEYELLKLYGDDPMVAPIMLSRATDCMAKADYPGAYKIMTELVRKFPSTRSAIEAKKMLVKNQN